MKGPLIGQRTTASSDKPEEETQRKRDQIKSSKNNFSWDGFTGPFGDVFASEFYSDFNKLLNLGRELNTVIPTPEVVFVGKSGHGKSSLLEALIGHPFTYVEKGRSTLRPLFFSLISNPSCGTPRVTLKRDPYAGGATQDIVISVAELEAEIERRNIFTEVPIYLTYEYKHCFNFTVIDTPGLLGPNEDKRQEVLEMVLELALPPHRLIVCVEEAKSWDSMSILDIAKKLDPNLSRTLFAYTSFLPFLSQMATSTDLNRYLSACPTDKKSFFLTPVPGRLREDLTTTKAYQETLKDLHNSEMQVLDQLNFDKKFANRIGITSIKRQLLEMLWRRYQEQFPEVLKRIRQKKRQTEDDLSSLSHLGDQLEESHLRSLASLYLSSFLQAIDRLITGTLEGNPFLNGQTLQEEKDHEATGPWLDSNHRPLKIESDLRVPYDDRKLYGGQQFERLLLEFKAICEKTVIPPITVHDIETAAGPLKMTTVSNLAWAASDLAQKRSEKAFRPLIDQLFKRAVYIMQRLTSTVDFILFLRQRDHRRDKLLGGAEETVDSATFPFFLAAVKSFYLQFVERLATSAKEKCLDEFHCTRIIPWEIKGDLKNSPSDPQKMVMNHVEDHFAQIKKRITKSVMLKIYNFFLVPLQNDLSTVLTSAVISLPSRSVSEIFEVEATRAKLDKEREEQTELGEKLKEQEKLYLDVSHRFSHPKGAGFQAQA